ncbi:NAD(P)-dependent dehydrogenase (short-subunit alcohol dehydrogenase family) [Paenibacillus forsythiae]|uniref:NAD(P)-dependent dehydrogenase (Short-subunit alcohol dehydrogenase family) n=1 Tax=Paenibacillus forsythiae TaxID=365616 RepID=A0ABU3H6N2_9BACL|nr:glucose 1-dehydrogenase [Paenibacillus forsythiae]MDT3426479.1 NAD(P)-dependent dehydrogenase (short-subunit alcohol dehydrogenase family) [Paenibacillus forsythiae]
MMRFKDKVAIITGGATGIGKATAMRICSEGGKVVIAGRSVEAGEEAIKEMKGLGYEAVFFPTDVSKVEDIKQLVDNTLAEFGQIDCIYSNAAITGNNQMLEDYDIEVFDNVFAVNIRSQFLLMKFAVPHMKSGGAIVNCSSLHGTIGMPGDLAYSASKHAIIGLTKSVAAELGPRGIRVNTICPGPVATKMMRRYEGMLSPDIDALEAYIAQGTALKRFGTEEEIAGSVCFLLSADSGYTTGATLISDGGYGVFKV